MPYAFLAPRHFSLGARVTVFVVEIELSAVSLHSQRQADTAAVSGTKPANWRSSALAAPVRQLTAMDWDAGSGKMSSSPFSNPSKIPCAADSGEAFGMSKPRFISVSMGPRTTAWTVTPWPAKSALRDCVMLNAAAFEME